MQILTIIILFLFSIQFPQIESNASQEDKSESLIYYLFNGKKTFLIAYANECYWWSDKKYYQVLAWENNKWEKIIISSKRNKKGEWSKPKVSTKIIDSESANQLIVELSKLSFWNLQNDKLNITKQVDGEGMTNKYSISDGINYRVEILQGNNFRIIESYEPEYFLSKMPELKERETFIKSKIKIENLFQQ